MPGCTSCSVDISYYFPATHLFYSYFIVFCPLRTEVHRLDMTRPNGIFSRLKFMRAPQLQNTVQRAVLNPHLSAPRLKEEPFWGEETYFLLRGLDNVHGGFPAIPLVFCFFFGGVQVVMVHLDEVSRKRNLSNRIGKNSWFYQHSMLHGSGISINIYTTIEPHVGNYFMEHMGSNNWEYDWLMRHSCQWFVCYFATIIFGDQTTLLLSLLSSKNRSWTQTTWILWLCGVVIRTIRLAIIVDQFFFQTFRGLTLSQSGHFAVEHVQRKSVSFSMNSMVIFHRFL